MPEPSVKGAWKIQALDSPQLDRLQRRRPLFTPRGWLAGGVAALCAPAAVLVSDRHGLFNDFYLYWAASKLLGQGGDPYDTNAVARVLHDSGVPALTGTGYSYPLFFAELMRPFTLLPVGLAAVVFSALSLVGLILAVALLVSALPSLETGEAVLFGTVSGSLSPVEGTILFGQANLIVLPLLALAYRGVASEWLLAAAASVKVYPITGLLASLTRPVPIRRRVRDIAPPVLLLAVLLAASGVGGLNGKREGLLGPDPFWSNQSVNGWISRLGQPSPWTRPPLPGLPIEPAVVAISLLILAAAAWVLWQTRTGPAAGRLALATWIGVVLAPKNSLWNFTPLLLCLAFAWPSLLRRRLLLAVAALAVVALDFQGFLNANRSSVYSTPALTWVSSVGLYGALLLGAVTAHLLLEPRLEPGTQE